MTVVVVGANGLLGSTLSTYFGALGISRTRCDITDAVSVSMMLGQYRPDIVINCAGIVPKAIDAAGTMQTFLTNSLGPKLLQQACDDFGARLIHVSTDCVFPGEFGNYNEDTMPHPPDIYGLSKYLGETTELPHLTIRTSFVGLPDAGGRGLLAWAQKNKYVIGYDKVYWNGLTTYELGSIIFNRLIPDGASGLVHLHGERISKYELLKTAQEVLGWDTLVIRESDIEGIGVPHGGDRSLDSNYPQYQTKKTFREMLEEMKQQHEL